MFLMAVAHFVQMLGRYQTWDNPDGLAMVVWMVLTIVYSAAMICTD